MRILMAENVVCVTTVVMLLREILMNIVKALLRSQYMIDIGLLTISGIELF